MMSPVISIAGKKDGKTTRLVKTAQRSCGGGIVWERSGLIATALRLIAREPRATRIFTRTRRSRRISWKRCF